MVTLTEIALHEAALQRAPKKDLVCVFAGATSGIGAATLAQLARTLESPTFYVIGRSAARFEQQQRPALAAANPRCRIVFLEAEFSLLAQVDEVCARVAAAESRVDCLYMSPGRIPLNGAEYTKEGLDSCFAISYFSRMRLVHGLLPLLRAAPAPRVVSVLNGGKEKAMLDDDLGLESNWSALNTVNHSTTMTTLAFLHLATTEKKIAFIHAYPGWVTTDNFASIEAPPSSGLVWRFTVAAVKTLAGALAYNFGITAEECGRRQVFYLTDDRYTAGVWRLSHTSDVAPPSAVLEAYGENGGPQRVWDYTLSIFKKHCSLSDR